MNGSVLRLLDANLNRAREALRVLEDYARFILADSDLSRTLKSLRHSLAEITGPYQADAILHRNTPGDVGKSNKTVAEQSREDLNHVIVAAGKRLGEALRSIEEFLKTISAESAAQIELLRYTFYDVEQKLSLTLRSPRRFAKVQLYVLITERLCKRPWLETAEETLLGGADCLQLREKELHGKELLARARQLVALCRKHAALCILNDRPDIAVLADADGVHVGQQDLPPIKVRKMVGTNKIIGVSTHCLEQARQAVLDGADYIGVGPFFPSSTKPRNFLPGAEYAWEVSSNIAIPAIAISGINLTNVDRVIETGLRAIAVSSAIIGDVDPRQATTDLKQRLQSIEAEV